jgi:hypothetical protein
VTDREHHAASRQDPGPHRQGRRTAPAPPDPEDQPRTGHMPPAHPSGIWPARAITIRHIPPASLALGLKPGFRPLVLTGRPPFRGRRSGCQCLAGRSASRSRHRGRAGDVTAGRLVVLLRGWGEQRVTAANECDHAVRREVAHDGPLSCTLKGTPLYPQYVQNLPPPPSTAACPGALDIYRPSALDAVPEG